MVIVWRKEWINAYESPWSIFEKVCLANQVSRTELLRTLGNHDVKNIKSSIIGNNRREFIQLSGFDPIMLKQYLGCDLVGHNRSIIETILKPIEYFREHILTWFTESMRWCPDCMRMGYHSWLHQFALVHICPIHQIKLISSCPGCLNEIPFLLSDIRLNDPFTCKCGYKLADFTNTLWSEWNIPVNITDDSVSEWIEPVRKNDYDRLLFLPRSASVQMFSLDPIIRSKYFYGAKQKSKREYSISQEFKDDVYIENKRCFRAIDRYIRRKFLKKHRTCILTLQELRKQEKGEFPPICPFAYAYVFWKHTLLQTEHFYKFRRDNEINTRKYLGFEFSTQLLERIIVDFKDKLFEITNLYAVDNREMFHWIINRITSELCLNYFYQWLEIAAEGAEQIRVPDWNQIRIMLEKSLPNIIFEHYADVGRKQAIEVIVQNEARSIKFNNIKCAISSKSMKKALRKMKSFTPQSVAMRIFDNPTDENKAIRTYVDQYVNKLTI